MIYRAVGDLCAFDIRNPELKHRHGRQISERLVMDTLLNEPLKFKLAVWGLDDRCFEMLKQLVGQTTYKRGARLHEAPQTVDCSGLVKWFYAQHGVWLPRRSIQQAQVGQKIDIGKDKLMFGDLIYSTSITGRNYFLDDPTKPIGHASIYYKNWRVFHASTRGVVLCDIAHVLGDKLERLQTIRRLVDHWRDFQVWKTNPYWEVETSDDIRWLILQNL